MIRSLLAAVALLAAALCPARADDAAKPSELKVGAFTFQIAPPWVAKASTSPMNKGGFTIPGKDGAAPVQADFYHFGAGQGGGTDENIKRWQTQFLPGGDGKPVPISREEVSAGEGKAQAVMVTLKGTFLSGPVMAPKKTPMPGYAMIGVILESTEGNVYLKITGPEAATLVAKDDIKKFVIATLTK